MNCAHESSSYRETQETPTSLKGRFKQTHRFFLRPALISIHLYQFGLGHAYSCFLLQSNRLIKHEPVNDCNHRPDGWSASQKGSKTVWTQRNDPNELSCRQTTVSYSFPRWTIRISSHNQIQTDIKEKWTHCTVLMKDENSHRGQKHFCSRLLTCLFLLWCCGPKGNWPCD